MKPNILLFFLFMAGIFSSAVLAQEARGYDYLKVNSDITALRIDPVYFIFEIANMGNGEALRAPEWSRKKGYVAVTNAGMFDVNDLPLGMSKINGRVIKSHRIKGHKMVFAIREKPGLIDLEREAFEPEKYHSYIQSIRMISADGRNVWARQDKKWSTACLAQDDEGRILLIHSRAPYPVHDFINALQKAELGIVKAIYLEGGPEASLYINLPGLQAEHIGSYETGFWEDDSNEEFWGLPNVIGVRRNQKLEK